MKVIRRGKKRHNRLQQITDTITQPCPYQAISLSSGQTLLRRKLSWPLLRPSEQLEPAEGRDEGKGEGNEEWNEEWREEGRERERERERERKRKKRGRENGVRREGRIEVSTKGENRTGRSVGK
jgi:hypothetical protein